MRAETTLWLIAMACAILLFFAPTTPGASWVYPGGMSTHSAGWDWIAPLAGMVAIGGLAFSKPSRPRVFPVVLGLVLAALAFVISTAASAGHSSSLATGDLDLDGMFAIYPAPMVLPFTVIAAVGAVCSLGLLSLRLRATG